MRRDREAAETERERRLRELGNEVDQRRTATKAQAGTAPVPPTAVILPVVPGGKPPATGPSARHRPAAPPRKLVDPGRPGSSTRAASSCHRGPRRGRAPSPAGRAGPHIGNVRRRHSPAPISDPQQQHVTARLHEPGAERWLWTWCAGHSPPMMTGCATYAPSVASAPTRWTHCRGSTNSKA
ncbi:hypothetical protein LV779_13935 [Streptomyces thinghirensis]|nr:hypothetical protein [Streptomyces thinghirensis]